MLVDRTPDEGPTLREETAELDDDAVFDMANLTETQTGISGIATITTELGRHGPKMRFAPRLGKGEPTAAMSIASEPSILFSGLSGPDLDRLTKPVRAWVRLNRETLLEYWQEGAWWTIDEVQTFVARLKRV